MGEPRITATDDPMLAAQHGLTHWDEGRRQYVATPAAGESEPAVIEDYSGWEYRDLQQEAKERGLPAGGSADELRARLTVDDQNEPAG